MRRRPIFPRIAIVGYGLMGASVALAVRRRWPSTHLIAIDRPDVARAAVKSKAVQRGGDDLGLAASADLVVLAAPVLANIRLLGELPAVVKRDALVTDVSSTKRLIVAAADETPLAFVGGHPVAGGARCGAAHALATLFDGHPWILTPRAHHAPQLEALESFVRGLGAVPHVMTPELHDRYLAIISHLPQFTASVLMHVVGKMGGDMALELAGAGLQDTTRLAASPPHVWKDIAATNTDAIRSGLDALIHALEHIRDGLAEGDAIEATFTSAVRWREALLRARGEE
jgi:prephenate dehydrogenase